MSEEISSKPANICPTCGTRLSEDAVRCLVCGTELASKDKPSRPTPGVQGSRMPQLTISLPAALGLVALFLGVGAAIVYFALQQTDQIVEPTITSTATETMTPTLTPTPQTPTVTNTPQPTPTPLTYSVKLGDTCSSIAFSFGISIQSIVLLNDLPATCDTLFEGQVLQIPQPTPTATPQPTATLSGAEATIAACEKIEYTVQENDTLSSISLNYQVSITILKEWNGRVNDTVRSGERIIIPLCERLGGPTPTPTVPPPYPAPNLLLPPDGAPFNLSDDVITLQWATVGALREGESYAVTIEDVTGGEGRKLVDYVSDTKYIVPNRFRPTDAIPHVMRWSVMTARASGTDEDGNPIWEPAGAVSVQRTFTWIGVGTQAATPTP